MATLDGLVGPGAVKAKIADLIDASLPTPNSVGMGSFRPAKA